MRLSGHALANISLLMSKAEHGKSYQSDRRVLYICGKDAARETVASSFFMGASVISKFEGFSSPGLI